MDMLMLFMFLPNMFGGLFGATTQDSSTEDSNTTTEVSDITTQQNANPITGGSPFNGDISVDGFNPVPYDPYVGDISVNSRTIENDDSIVATGGVDFMYYVGGFM
jgi:hypothetical protein